MSLTNPSHSRRRASVAVAVHGRVKPTAAFGGAPCVIPGSRLVSGRRLDPPTAAALPSLHGWNVVLRAYQRQTSKGNNAESIAPAAQSNNPFFDLIRQWRHSHAA